MSKQERMDKQKASKNYVRALSKIQMCICPTCGHTHCKKKSA